MAVRFRLDRELKDMDEWAAREDNREFLFFKPLAILRQELASGSNRNVDRDLQSIGVWFGAVAGVRVLRREPDAWLDLARAYRYFSWSMRVAMVRFDRERLKFTGIFPSPAALHLAHAILINDTAEFARIETKFVESPRTGLFGTYWKFQSLPVFVRALLARVRNKTLDDRDLTLAALGPYQPIFDAWNDPAALGLAIAAMCDEHGRQLKKEDNVFDPYPYNVFPVELLLLRRVRSALALPTPDVDHPLVRDNPFMELPPRVPELRDEVLDELEAKLRKAFSGL